MKIIKIIILFFCILFLNCISKYQKNQFVPKDNISLTFENIRIYLYIVNYNYYKKSAINECSYLIKVTFTDTLQNFYEKKTVPENIVIDSCWIYINNFIQKQYILFNKKNRYVYESGKIVEYNSVLNIPTPIDKLNFNIVVSRLNDINNINESKIFNFEMIRISEKRYKFQPVPDI